MLTQVSRFFLGSSGILMAITYWGISTSAFTSKQLQALLISMLVGVLLSCITTYLTCLASPLKASIRKPPSDDGGSLY